MRICTYRRDLTSYTIITKAGPNKNVPVTVFAMFV